jgi:hypothetical protein
MKIDIIREINNNRLVLNTTHWKITADISCESTVNHKRVNATDNRPNVLTLLDDHDYAEKKTKRMMILLRKHLMSQELLWSRPTAHLHMG